MANRPVVVIDNGTGFTKVGYSGCFEPNYIFPTCIAESPPQLRKGALDDLDFYIGQEALDATAKNPQKYVNTYPIRHGVVENWDHIEKIWQQCFYKYLRCEPEEHAVILTEPPLNPPENREYTAEIMFETFGVPGLHIAVQAVLALTASWADKKSKEKGLDRCETGTVIDSGDGVTHIIPVYEGHVIYSAIKHIPLAGRDITEFTFNMIKEREHTNPEVNMKNEARKIKEAYGYVCGDLAKEFAKYDEDPAKHIQKWHGTVPKTRQPWEIDVGPEQFLGPEVFFHPEIYSLDFTTPLPELVDSMICQCPIDTRKGLYRNIVLSGGTTTFKHFGRRLQRDIKSRVDARMQREWERRVDKGKERLDIEVNVITHAMQKYAVWFGGSVLGEDPGFHQHCHTKAQYDEHGPSICRLNAAMGQNLFQR
eukprot:TRINITY_DN303_c0_g1_i1.p2 TRINITY_DN303_c0_g1~~TRINITY_DN303_c0_g1_i1.p2  ORF type:complete len:454 (+),score=191.94 TRINITY_DN303_c0_g1_i1:94-1362(+)